MPPSLKLLFLDPAPWIVFEWEKKDVAHRSWLGADRQTEEFWAIVL